MEIALQLFEGRTWLGAFLSPNLRWKLQSKTHFTITQLLISGSELMGFEGDWIFAVAGLQLENLGVRSKKTWHCCVKATQIVCCLSWSLKNPRIVCTWGHASLNQGRSRKSSSQRFVNWSSTELLPLLTESDLVCSNGDFKTLPWNPRMVGVGRDLRDHLVPNLLLEQLPQGPIQPGFEHC